MIEDVKKRLEALGFTVTDADTWALSFVCGKVENHIKNSCNVPAVPEGLREVAVDLACGEYLYSKFNAGQFDYEQAVSSIKEGDTQVNYSDGLSDAELISKLINDLRSRELDFAAYRCIAW